MKPIIKILSIAIMFVLVCSMFTGCSKETTTESNKDTSTEINTTTKNSTTNETNYESKPVENASSTISADASSDTTTTPTTPSTSSISNTQSETSPSIIETNLPYKIEFTNPSTIPSKRLSSFDMSANIISFTSTQKPTSQIIKQFYTEEEFRSYLDKYSDIQDNSKDTIELTKDSFKYTHNFSFYSSSGYSPDFFFIGHPDMPANYEIDSHSIFYDEKTGNAYIVLEKEDKFEKEVDGSKTVYGIMYMNIDENFIQENKLEKIFIVLPE